MTSLQGSCLSHPIRPNVNGTLATIDSREAIAEESIKAIVETMLRERVMVPGYGIPNWVFSVIDFGFGARVAYFVRRAINDYEPLVSTVQVAAGELTDEGFVAGLAQGRVALSITYTLVGSNVERNLVFPFWNI